MAIQTTTLVANAVLHDMSNDGRFVSYTTVSGGIESLFRLDRTTGSSLFVDSEPFSDHGASGARGIKDGALSADGRFIFYAKGNLEGLATGLYVKDLQSGAPATEVAAGVDAQDISADGQRILYGNRFATFDSRYFVKDIPSGTVTKIADAPFVQDNAQLTPDGRYAVIDTPPFLRVYDIQNGTSTQITGNPSPSGGGFSDSGRYVGYYVLEPSTTVAGHVYVRDLTNGSTVIASSSATGVAGNGDSRLAALSGDGRHVAFYSDATNLIPGDTNGQSDLFVKDLNTGAIRRIASNISFADLLLSFDGSTVIYNNGSIVSTIFLPPAITIASVSGDNLVSATEEAAPIQVNGTSDAIGRTVTVTSPSGVVGTGVVQANGSWSVNVASPGVADGSRTFSAAVADEFGVRGETTRAALFDSVAPALTFTVAGDNYVNLGETSSTVIAGTSNSIGLPVGLKIDGFSLGTATVQPNGQWSFTFSAVGTPQGVHSIEARVSDLAGNVTSVSTEFEIDTTPPQIAIKSIAGDNVVSPAEYKSPVTITGTSDAVGQMVALFVGSEERGAAVVGSNKIWTTQVDFSGVAGQTTVTAAVIDRAGNLGRAFGEAFVDTDVIRASVKVDGTEAQGDPYEVRGFSRPSISADGRFILFSSPNPTTFTPSGKDLLLKDLQTGALTEIGPAEQNIGPGEISDDGRYILYSRQSDGAIVRHDRETGTEKRINANKDGVAANVGGGFADMSGDGQFVVFSSHATNLVSGLPSDTSERVYVKNMETGVVSLVSFQQPENDPYQDYVDHSGIGANRYVAFVSRSAAPGGDANDARDVFVRDLQTGEVKLVSATPSGAAGNGESIAPQISADGRYVAFVSYATDLIAGPTLEPYQAYVRDLQTGVTRLVSATLDGSPIGAAAGSSWFLSLSSDGRYISFGTWQPSAEVYVKDMLTGQLVQLSSGVRGTDTFDAEESRLSPDGRYAVFPSRANELVPRDNNALEDIFLRRLGTPATLSLNPIAGDDRVTAGEASAALAIGGTSNAIGGEVTIRVDGVVVGTTVVAAGGSWSSTINTIPLSPTTHTVTASVRDAPGFTSSDGIILTIDSGAPPAIASYNGGLPAGRALAGGFAGAGSTIALFDGGVSLGTTVANVSGLWEINFAALSIGVHTLAATATPPGGSASALSASFKVIVTSQGQSILGGPGADTLIGGAGLDTADFSAKAASVVVFLNGAIAAAVTVGGAAEDTVRDIENIIGGSGADTLVGDGKANVLTGGGGGDFLFSNGFNPDGTMKSGAGSDALNGGDGDDGLFGGDGADTLNGGDGDDGMVGGGGGDTLNGGAGGDFLFGGSFSTSGTFLANSGDDTLNGGDGDDGLYGQDGNDTVNGDAGNDYVEGGAGNDTINGGAGSDFLLGQGGNDTINGGVGFDYMYGGLGADTFIFRKGDSADWVLDFSAGQGDKLRLLNFSYATFAAVSLVDLSSPGNPAVQFSALNTVNGSFDQLTIFGVTLAQLNATNVLVA